MALRINHNTAALNAHRNLQANDAAMTKTLEKLSSGLKINRAADGPANLVISEQMRAQIAGITQAIDNSETAISMVQTTEANLSEVSRLLTDIRQLSIHASNEGVNDSVMLQADQREIENALATIDRISDQAQFGNKKLLDGSNGVAGTTTGAGLEFIGAKLATKDSRNTGYEVQITQNASQAKVDGTVALTQEMVSAGETLSVIENGISASYTTNVNDTVETAFQNFLNNINRNGLRVNASMDQGGKISIEHKDYGSDPSFQVFSTTAGVLSKVAGEITVADKGDDIKGFINGESALGKGQILEGIAGAAHVDGLKIRFAGKAGGEGGLPEGGASVGRVYVTQNGLNFHVGGNQDQTVGISIESTHSKTLGRNVDNESYFSSLADIDVTSYEGAQDALKLVDKAIDEITSARGELGAFQKNTLEANLSNLRVANENLVSSESVLRDTDMAAELATFTRNQIISESATAMLAQANQAPTSVLKLLS